MIYDREELFKVFSEVVSISSLDGHPLGSLRSTDYRYGNLYCNTCKSHVGTLVRVNGRWACQSCNKAGISTKYKAAFVHRTVNDLLDYFGQVNSECLFDSNKLQGFVNFVGLDKRINEYTLFLSFVRKILFKEVGSLGILDFLSAAEKSITKLSQPAVGVEKPAT